MSLPSHPNVLRPLRLFVASVAALQAAPAGAGDAALCIVMEKTNMSLAELIQIRRYVRVCMHQAHLVQVLSSSRMSILLRVSVNMVELKVCEILVGVLTSRFMQIANLLTAILWG